MKNFIVGKLRSKNGLSESLIFIPCVGALLLIFYILTMAFVPFMVNNDVKAYTKTIVRQIEIHGAVDQEIKNFANELAEVYNLDPEITYDADFIDGTDHIQIRDEFEVKVKVNSEIVLLNGTFFDSVTFIIPLGDEKVGISEKLWK